jgi:hypothetical protein
VWIVRQSHPEFAMNAANAQHPSVDLLKAYGLGKLDDASAARMSLHLEGCVDCRRFVAENSGDSFLGRLRHAQNPPDASPELSPAPFEGEKLGQSVDTRPPAPVGDTSNPAAAPLAAFTNAPPA